MSSPNLERLAQSGSLKREVWRVLTLCHTRRNRAEYEGVVDIDDQLVADLLRAAEEVAARVSRLGPLPADAE